MHDKLRQHLGEVLFDAESREAHRFVTLTQGNDLEGGVVTPLLVCPYPGSLTKLREYIVSDRVIEIRVLPFNKLFVGTWHHFARPENK